jgi:hypothetical protein
MWLVTIQRTVVSLYRIFPVSFPDNILCESVKCSKLYEENVLLLSMRLVLVGDGVKFRPHRIIL